jgi:hypothetical protein
VNEFMDRETAAPVCSHSLDAYIVDGQARCWRCDPGMRGMRVADPPVAPNHALHALRTLLLAYPDLRTSHATVEQQQALRAALEIASAGRGESSDTP